MESNKRRLVIGLIGGVLFVAGLADIKFKGMLYQKFPKGVQARLERMMGS